MNTLDQIKKITEELFSRLKIQVKIEIKESEDKRVNIQLETEEPGLLIGYHGETLSAIQKMISMIVFRKLGNWVNILVNVADYREKRQENLEKMAATIAQKVRFSGQAQALPPMPAIERRIIHLALSHDSSIETASEGIGRERHVVVKPKG